MIKKKIVKTCTRPSSKRGRFYVAGNNYRVYMHFVWWIKAH